MTPRVTSELLLVGSLPADSAEEALRSGGELFGDLVFALPDGETGPRRLWVGLEREQLFRPHPEIDVVQDTESPDRVPKHANDVPIFQVREGVRELTFERWPRIDYAIESYDVFRRLKADGTIPSHVRFQVSLPFPTSVLHAFKADFAHDHTIVAPAFEDLVARELVRLTEAIPPSELALQWDLCHEVLNLEDTVTWMPSDDAWERFTGPVTRLARLVPEEALLGYHLCYGTFPEWPLYEARDLALLVRMANFAVAESGRTVDWLHLAGPRFWRSDDERFFAPLTELDIGDTRLFLGIVLLLDGIPGFKRRHATASKILSDFGVAMYCGFGRQRDKDNYEAMREHRDVVTSLRPVA